VSVWVYECVFDNTISTHAIVLQQRWYILQSWRL